MAKAPVCDFLFEVKRLKTYSRPNSSSPEKNLPLKQLYMRFPWTLIGKVKKKINKMINILTLWVRYFVVFSWTQKNYNKIRDLLKLNDATVKVNEQLSFYFRTGQLRLTQKAPLSLVAPSAADVFCSCVGRNLQDANACEIYKSHLLWLAPVWYAFL